MSCSCNVIGRTESFTAEGMEREKPFYLDFGVLNDSWTGLKAAAAAAAGQQVNNYYWEERDPSCQTLQIV